MESDEPVGVVVVGHPPVPASARVLGTVTHVGLPAAVARLRPRAIVVDMDAGRDGGIAAIAIADDRVPDVPVVAWSASASHTVVLDAVRAGATGFAVGPDRDGIGAIVAAVVKGRAAFSPGLAELVLDAVADPSATVAPPLSPRESDVLQLVVEGLTARQIAGRLVLSPRTVENHVQRLLRKFDVPGRGALVRYAIEHGLA